MARVAKRKQRLIDTVDQALTLGIQLIESRGASARTPTEIQQAVRQNSQQAIKDIAAGRTNYDYGHEFNLLQSLQKVKVEILSIDSDRVEALRDAGASTEQLLDIYVIRARGYLKEVPGPYYSINQIFEAANNAKGKYSARAIRTLTRIRVLVNSLDRQLRVLRRKAPAWLPGRWTLSIIFTVAILSIPACYIYNHRAAPSGMEVTSSQSAAAAVKTNLREDVQRINVNVAEEKSPLDKAATAVKDVWDIIDNVPKILVGLSVFLAFLRRVLS
jgi:hypothetical protein